MRKILFALPTIVILLTGCKKIEDALMTTVDENIEQRLVCSQKFENVDASMNAIFKGDELTYFGITYQMDLSSHKDKEIEVMKKQDMCAVVKKSVSTYTNAFTNCKQSLDDKSLVITADFDIDKIGSEDKIKPDLNDIKEGLESQNYSCTVNKIVNVQ